MALLAAMACGGQPGRMGRPVPSRGDSVSITVENQNFYDANVFAAYQGQTERRLGTVTGFTTDTFRIPWYNAQLRMRMNFIAAGGTLSNILTVDPGDVLQLIIEPDAHRRRGL